MQQAPEASGRQTIEKGGPDYPLKDFGVFIDRQNMVEEKGDCF
ncbi:hypothetical protein [Methanofollis fontis]|nr:hypothetical protein [Methanofollis fontis]